MTLLESAGVLSYELLATEGARLSAPSYSGIGTCRLPPMVGESPLSLHAAGDSTTVATSALVFVSGSGASARESETGVALSVSGRLDRIAQRSNAIRTMPYIEANKPSKRLSRPNAAPPRKPTTTNPTIKLT